MLVKTMTTDQTITETGKYWAKALLLVMVLVTAPCIAAWLFLPYKARNLLRKLRSPHDSMLPSKIKPYPEASFGFICQFRMSVAHGEPEA
jgi:hypothetical protein